MHPSEDGGWDDSPLGIRIPDDARDLERDVLAYHREQRALRRRRALRRLFPGGAGIMPLIASILAVCLIAGMMLSVFTISPAEPAHRPATPAPSAPATPGRVSTGAPASHSGPPASRSVNGATPRIGAAP